MQSLLSHTSRFSSAVSWLRPAVAKSSSSFFGGRRCGAEPFRPPRAGSLAGVVVRSKHSRTQIKRLFKNHPARHRVHERLGILPSTDPPPTRSYDAVIASPEILSNGWTPPPPPDTVLPDYPFAVSRTKNKPKDAVGFLPVYSKMRKDGTLTVTRIKKVSGDRETFIKELRAALEIPIYNNPNDDVIRVRTGGTIEVRGNHVRPVRRWLAGLGF